MKVPMFKVFVCLCFMDDECSTKLNCSLLYVLNITGEIRKREEIFRRSLLVEDSELQGKFY